VTRKRSDKSETASRTSSVSSFVVRQQTKHGRWLRLRVMLTSYSTSSGQFVLCLSHVIACEPTAHPARGALASANHRHRTTLSRGTCSSPQTAHCDDSPLSSAAAEHYADRRSASQQAETTSPHCVLESKTSLYRTTADVYLAWAGSGRTDTAADRACYCNDRRAPHSCQQPSEWSKPYGPRLVAPDFVSYRDVDNCTQLQQLLNCDASSYNVTSAQSSHQSAAYSVDVADRNVYENQ